MSATRLMWWSLLSAALIHGQGADNGWPQQVESNGTRLVIYQPQVDSWQKNRLIGRAAVTVTTLQSTKPEYGIITLSARTGVDKETRVVTLEDLQITACNFPSAADQHTIMTSIRASAPNWPRTISLDRLLASLAITSAENRAESVSLKNDPPRIIYSERPSVLVILDGEPVFRPVAGTSLKRVLNTPALLLFDTSKDRYYLDGGNRWMSASALNGTWETDPAPPPALNQIKADAAKDEPVATDIGEPLPSSPTPEVIISQTPAELLEIQGPPNFAPIAGTGLLYVTNTGNDIFQNVATQEFYTLLSGRWYKAPGTSGPWQFVPGSRLPADFSHIPAEGPKGDVLASIPGTTQARESVVASLIPQTAAVNRNEAVLHVDYDGEPRFQPVESTSLQYAVNTATDVILANGQYYAVSNGVWFTANAATGPWSVADSVPPEIYSIPPNSPLYHVRYVYVYDATPDVVYTGYTPGYTGAFVSDGVVVYGTGWTYPGWCGSLYFGWPWTWGFGFHYSYWSGGWFWRPWGHPWWYHDWGSWHRVYHEHWGSHWNHPDRTYIRNNVNIYNRWSKSVVATHNTFGSGAHPAVAQRSHEDLYAGHDGKVYQHRENRWYRQDGKGWKSSSAPADNLERERQARSAASQRVQEFHERGHVVGIPRTPAPHLSMPRMSMPHMGGGRVGRR